MRHPLAHTALSMLAVCALAGCGTPALLKASGGGAEADAEALPATGPRRPIPVPLEIPGSPVNWGTFARLPGIQASSIAARHLASSELGLIEGWGLYFQGLSAPYTHRPTPAQGTILAAYRRWLGGSVKPLPTPSETAASVGD